MLEKRPVMAGSGKTKNVVIYEKLRQRIIRGKLRPGRRLVMADLAKAFNCSETPVREAIRRLESESYVTFTPHAGATVTPINDRELSEIYLIRISLEALATRLAVPHISRSDIEWLKKKNNEMEASVRKNRYENLAQINKAFHLRIYRAAPYPRLFKMISDLWDSFERWPCILSYVPERALASVKEHGEIIQALEECDLDKADSLMKAQKERSLLALKNYMAQTYFSQPEATGKKRKSNR